MCNCRNEIAPNERIHSIPTPEHHCTVCGRELDEYDLQENFGFNYHIGYGSRHDTEIVHAQFCCDCFDNLLDKIRESSVYDPIIGEYMT